MQNEGEFNPSYSFSGHETFPLRYAWLSKAVHHLELDDELFSRSDALVTLGVGKNMVSAIRHWSFTFGVAERRGAKYYVSDLGKYLIASDGWDPYLEDPGTLWLLHWQLVRNLEKASTWFLAFTQWNRESFTRDDLVDWLLIQVESQSGTRATRGSIKRDTDVFIRTYVPFSVTATRPPEETFDSPLVELGLIREIEREVYAFARGQKATLPDEIFVYALMDYWNVIAPQQQTLGFENILHGRGSPGAAFKLTENALVERLERLPSWTSIRFDDTAGMRQLLRLTDGAFDPMTALKHYYDAIASGVMS